MNIYLFRLSQVIQYGWKDAKSIAVRHNVSRVRVFCDILRCFQCYRLRSIQYVKDDFWGLSLEERAKKGAEYRINNIRIDEWTKDCYENRKFLKKWMDYRWSLSGKRYHKRLMAYTKRYNMGEGCILGEDVVLERNHGLNGTIKIGNHVNLLKHLYIDYSGFLTIEDNVGISNGVIIETHTHSGYAMRGKGRTMQTSLTICEGVTIGVRSVILDGCRKIGRGARIGAGTIVRKDIPPYAIVIGNPAKIVGFTITPSELLDVEKNVPKDKRTSLEEFTKLYNTYLKNKIATIREYVNY